MGSLEFDVYMQITGILGNTVTEKNGIVYSEKKTNFSSFVVSIKMKRTMSITISCAFSKTIKAIWEIIEYSCTQVRL